MLTLAACGDASRDTTLVVRSTLPDGLLDYVEESFEAANPRVDVRFSTLGAEESLAEATTAGRAAFDVWWGAPATTLAQAADAGLLLAYRPPWIAQAGVGQPDALARWQVTLVSPFVIAFNREEVPLARAPTDWGDILHFRWAEEVYLLDPSSSDEGAYFLGAMLVQSLRDDDDLLRGFDWQRRLDIQAERYVRDPQDAIRSLANGEAMLAILPRYVVEEARGTGAAWIHYRLPESGTPMLALGIAISESTEVPSVARRFVDHVGTMDVATASKLHTRWQPSHGDVDMSRLPDDFELEQRWIPYALAIDTLVRELDGWVERWDAEVRDRGGR